MEKIGGYDPEVCLTANTLRRSYSLLRTVEGFRDLKGTRSFGFKGVNFETDCLISGLSKMTRAKYREMEEMGQRYLAWEILEEIDSRYSGF